MNLPEEIILKAGTTTRIVVNDSNGRYVTQVLISIPFNVKCFGKEDVVLRYFGDATRVSDANIY